MTWGINPRTGNWKNSETGQRVKRNKSGWSQSYKPFGTDRQWAIFDAEGNIVRNRTTAVRTFSTSVAAMNAADQI
jgi:hypothetical protein